MEHSKPEEKRKIKVEPEETRKVESNILDFSDEILLKIFSFLGSEDIVSCVPVHEKFHRIAYDDALWRGDRQFGKVNLAGKKVPLGLVQELFNHGTKFLNLEGATIFTQIGIKNPDGSKNDLHFGGIVEFQSNPSVKYLDLSHLKFSSQKGEKASETRARYLTRLLSMCPNLTKLSLQGLRIFDRTFNHFLSEKQCLTHLNLFSCSGLVWSDVQTIVVRCRRLIELNLGNCTISPSHHWIDGFKNKADLETVCDHLPKNMQKISLSNLEVNDAAVKKLVNRCQNLIELDLYGPPNERLTGKTAQCIIEGLSHSLVKLALPCIAEETKPLELASMPKLKCLWMTGLSRRRRKILKKQIPHLLINETSNLLSNTIASPRDTYLKDQGLWEVPSTILNYNSVKEKLSEVNKKWSHLGDLETS